MLVLILNSNFILNVFQQSFRMYSLLFCDVVWLFIYMIINLAESLLVWLKHI